jgi:transposase
LDRHGIYTEESDLFGGRGRRFLALLSATGRTAEGVLSPGAWGALGGLVEHLESVRDWLAAIARGLREHLPWDPMTRRLDTAPGIGLILAHVIAAEVGSFKRFQREEKLARYCCLAPMARDSGEPDPTAVPKARHLGRQGNLTLKWALIEAAHGAVRHGGRWRAMWDRVTNHGRRDRNRGYLKVARALVTVLFAMMRDGTDYTETPPARPGSEPAKKDPRSGTGQPCAPMTQA